MKKVVVIGGGIAGLAAARELARNGFAVTVLEAKNRFGGRIHTVHDGPIPVELGAEFLHGENPAVRRLLEEANLSTQTVPDRNRIFADGKFEETKIWDIVGEVFNRVDPRRPDCSFADFLAMQPVEPEVKRLTQNFVQGFDAADPRRISAHALRRAEYAAEHMAGSTQLRVTAGYSALVEFLQRNLRARGGSAVTGAGVRKVTWRPRRVEVLFEQDGKAETIEADAAVIALPLGVLKTNQVVFEPSLPQKVEAAREMQFGNVVKVIFHFREVFWREPGFIHAFDELLPTWWDDSRGPVLVGWAGGPKAEALRDYDLPRLKSLGLEILAKIFSDRVATLRERLVTVHYHDWANDPRIRGAYSYLPVNGLDLPGVLAEPVAETLFFAGEATVSDAQTGTVFGSVETGLRAAAEIRGQ